MSQEKKFYVYVHRYASGPKMGHVFYVGKGHGNRYTSTANRNRYWKNVSAKYGFTPEIVISDIRETCAFSFERALIAFYGRDNLCNMTDGGEGPSGFKHSEETRKKMSKDRLGIKHTNVSKRKISDAQVGEKNHMFGKVGKDNHFFGKKHTDHARLKMSKSLTGRKLSKEHVIKIRRSQPRSIPVSNGDGHEFQSMREAVRWLQSNGFKGASKSSISDCCRGKLNKAYGYIWTYA